MILLLTMTGCCTSDALAQICEQRNIPLFRFNLDRYNEYQFLWTLQGFEIIDPTGRSISSSQITAAACYKALLPYGEKMPFSYLVDGEDEWVKSCLNYITNSLANWLKNRKLLRLWDCTEIKYFKVKQMELAQKYFAVPEFMIHWGFHLTGKEVVAKTLTQRFFTDQKFAYVTKVDRNTLDPVYPWFTQDIAPGSRDATVVYINGHVHCYQFATERGELTDWRVTQGSDRNQWIPWNAGKEFEEKVDAYMKELGLKFGRLDFIIGGAEVQFLEVNPCGQFGWLDDRKLTLHNEVVDAILDPESTVAL